MSRTRHLFDVVVVGAGVAGSVTATKLADAGYAVLLLEATCFDRPRFGEFRTSRGVAAVDNSKLLGPKWRDAHLEAAEFLSTWGGGIFARNVIFDPFGGSLVLDRSHFDRTLALAAHEHGVTLRFDARFKAAWRSDGGWRILYEESGTPQDAFASFMIICRGRNGPRIQGLPLRQQHFDRLICFGMHTLSYRGDMRPAVESYDFGWAYSVGLPTGGLMVNLFTEGDKYSSRQLSKSLAFFLNEIARCPIASARTLNTDPDSAAAVKTFVVDASSCWTRPAVGPGWCLAGDCAQSMDPLSSSGIVQALEHANRLTDNLIRCGVSFHAIPEDYARHLDAAYRTYLEERVEVYSWEARWSTPFWNRRRRESTAIAQPGLD